MPTMPRQREPRLSIGFRHAIPIINHISALPGITRFKLPKCSCHKTHKAIPNARSAISDCVWGTPARQTKQKTPVRNPSSKPSINIPPLPARRSLVACLPCELPKMHHGRDLADENLVLLDVRETPHHTSAKLQDLVNQNNRKGESEDDHPIVESKWNNREYLGANRNVEDHHVQPN